MFSGYEFVCQHCGGIYLATALDDAIIEMPLCMGCLMRLDSQMIARWWRKPAKRLTDRESVSQALEDRTRDQ
jgi:hypothetical protein